jgi:transposase
MTQNSTHTVLCAGIDTGKTHLDYALAGATVALRDRNNIEGRPQLIAFFRKHGVQRVGIEASGGYEFEICDELRAAGFEVVVLQPQRVHAYAKFRGRRAKNDRLDAMLIADCTAAQSELRDPPDPRLASFAEHLTLIDQITEDIARAKIRRERYREQRHKDLINEQIKRLTATKRDELRRLAKAIRVHADLARRMDVLLSIQGIGPPTAIALVVRMPELGAISREKAASLIGVAPFDRDSGQHKGKRTISGGRARPRTALFAAMQAAARKWNPALVDLYNRLIKAGKPHNVAIIACVRKMVTFANTLLAQNRLWEVRG